MSLVREVSRRDFAALEAICSRALDQDALTEQELLDVLWRPPGGDVSFGLAAELSGRPVGMIFATVPALQEGPASGFIQLLAVDPDAWGLGIGRTLITEMEAALADHGLEEVHAAGVGPRYLWAGIDMRYTPALCLFERLGYERYYDGINMDVVLAKATLDTAADEVRLRDAGIEVRRLADFDRAPFIAWMVDAWEPGWSDEALFTMRRDPITCHVALKNGAFIGFAAYDANRRGWFGPMGTSEDARGTGIGTVLLRRCLRDMRDRGDERCEISWTGPVHFYARGVGARVNRILPQLKKPLR